MAEKPVKTFNLGANGEFLSCAVWENAGKLSFSFDRAYKAKDGQYMKTKTFWTSHLPYLAELASMAFRWGLEARVERTDQPLATESSEQEMPF